VTGFNVILSDTLQGAGTRMSWWNQANEFS